MGDANWHSGMKPNPSTCRSGAFSLVELLCVMGIIAILAALLLPVLEQSQGRVRRIECENNLRQQGMAFHLFMHEHDGKFPMAVSAADGGSWEFVQNGYAMGGEFYFSYRQFQVLSNELRWPVILICPADTRLPATNFAALQNSNLSYFIDVKAKYDNPNSVLAGDRNLTTNAYASLSLLQIDPASRLMWTWELHRFKGNLLFSDGRVEEWNNAALSAGAGEQLAGADLFLPSIRFDPAPVMAVAAGARAHPEAVPRTGTPQTTPNPPGGVVPGGGNFSGGQLGYSPSPNAPGPTPIRPVTVKTNVPKLVSSNAPAETIVPATVTGPVTPTADDRLVKILRRILIGFYLFFLLVIALWYLFAGWRRSRRRNTQGLGEA